MTNEELVALIKQGSNNELTSLLWDRVQKIMYMKADRVYKVYSKRCKQCGVELWDIRQSSYIAFLQALRGYDTKKGYTFAAYLSYPFKNTVSKLLGNRGTKINPLDNCESFEKVIGGEDDDLTLLDVLKDENAVDVQAVLDIQADSDVIRGEVEKLSPLQRQVIEMHYFENTPFTDIAKHFCLSYNYIIDVKNTAFRTLRQSSTLRYLYDEMNHEKHFSKFLRPDHYFMKGLTDT